MLDCKNIVEFCEMKISDSRRKQFAGGEGLQPVTSAPRSTLHASTNTLTPIDPEQVAERESACDYRYLQDTKESLKKCVETLNTKLQVMVRS